MFEKLKNIAEKAGSATVGNIMSEVWDEEDLQERIIYFNTRKQLFEQGIDKDGNSLGGYAKFTVEIKKRDGLPWDHVTLYQEGEFYKSFYIVPNHEGFEILAETEKETSDLAERYGEGILGLSAESIEQLKPLIIERFIYEFISAIAP